MGGRGRGVELVTDRGCSRLLVDLGASSLQSLSPSSSSSSFLLHNSGVGASGRTGTMSRGAFAGLVICVTGLSKEARKQVMEAAERLGGQYSPSLHPQCTHLVVQSFGGRKFEHALKHGLRNGLFVVTLGWFVDSVRRNVRLSESLYSVTKTGIPMDSSDRFVESKEAESSCLPIGLKHPVKQSEVIEQFGFSDGELKESHSPLFSQSVYIDSDVSAELRRKVVEAAACEGAMFLDQWFVGCGASYVVCEETSVQRYLGHADNIVTPMWVLKTARERSMQRCICISADLARQLGMLLANLQDGLVGQETYCPKDVSIFNRNNVRHEERQKIADHAKLMVRSRRLHTMQTCQVPLHPITPSTLLDSICWTISEPTSTATVYTDTTYTGNSSEVFFDSRSDEKDVEASFSNLCRSLTESEKKELVLRHHFLTILFPVDRFAEMGPTARTFFSNEGFACLQVLDFIYTFYQEDMLDDEIKAAIHTDSRHADRLRSAYSSERNRESGRLMYKRIDFLGSRRSFEKLKRISVDNSSNVYELLIRA